MNLGGDHKVVDEAALERGHEVFETNVPLVIKFGIGLTALAIISMVPVSYTHLRAHET